MFRRNYFVDVLAIALLMVLGSRRSAARPSHDGVLQAALIAPGSPPFHLRALISTRSDENRGEVEMYWVNLTKWRRTICSPEFSQILGVNGNRIFEQDSEDYLPLAYQTLLTAMVAPQPLSPTIRTLKAGKSRVF